jgi:hypothetical protein
MHDWLTWLSDGDKPEDVQMSRRNVDKGLPCGNEDFVKKMGQRAGR